jgi:hypothetical protein
LAGRPQAPVEWGVPHVRPASASRFARPPVARTPPAMGAWMGRAHASRGPPIRRAEPTEGRVIRAPAGPRATRASAREEAVPGAWTPLAYVSPATPTGPADVAAEVARCARRPRRAGRQVAWGSMAVGARPTAIRVETIRCAAVPIATPPDTAGSSLHAILPAPAATPAAPEAFAKGETLRTSSSTS